MKPVDILIAVLGLLLVLVCAKFLYDYIKEKRAFNEFISRGRSGAVKKPLSAPIAEISLPAHPRYGIALFSSSFFIKYFYLTLFTIALAVLAFIFINDIALGIVVFSCMAFISILFLFVAYNPFKVIVFYMDGFAVNSREYPYSYINYIYLYHVNRGRNSFNVARIALIDGSVQRILADNKDVARYKAIAEHIGAPFRAHPKADNY